MSPTVERLYHSALSLSEAERQELIDALLAEEEGPVEPPLHEAWRQEVERRSQEIDSGVVKLSPWCEVKERVRKNLGLDPDG